MFPMIIQWVFTEKSLNLTVKTEIRKNILFFEGVASWFELYVNGKYVGCSSVSHCCSEFKINLLG